MSMYFYGSVQTEADGRVYWELHTGSAAEDLGVARLSVRVHIGDVDPDGPEAQLESDLLLGLECLGQAIQTASRSIAWTYSLLPSNGIQREEASMTGE